MTTDTHLGERLDLGERSQARWLRLAQLALVTGAVSSVAEAGLLVFTDAGHDSGHFHRTADYWLTGAGVPAALASLTLVIAVRQLQGRPGSRLARAAVVMNSLACLLLATQMAVGVAAAAEVRWGPSYPLATVVAFIALSLFAASSWRLGLIPRWMLALWPVIWVIGSMAAQGPTPLLLTAYLIGMALVLTRRVPTRRPVWPAPRRGA